MKPLAHKTRLIALVTLALSLFAISPALASADPELTLDAQVNSTAQPGATVTYHLVVYNLGDPTSGELEFSAAMPPGIEVTSMSSLTNPFNGQIDCSLAGLPAAVATCKTSAPLGAHRAYSAIIDVSASVQAGAPLGPATAHFTVSAGAATPSMAIAPLRITTAPPGFGFATYDGQVSADAAGDPFTQAGGYPYGGSTSFDYNTLTNPQPLKGDMWPVQATRDVFTEFPPGLIANPNAAPVQCTSQQLQLAPKSATAPEPLCPAASQVGTAMLRLNGLNQIDNSFGPLPVFEMVAPPGVPARFAFNVIGTVIVLDAKILPGPGYDAALVVRTIPLGLQVKGTTVELWGTPANPEHDADRNCPGRGSPYRGEPNATSPNCETPYVRPPLNPLVRLPTSCTGPVRTTATIDSWAEPGAQTPDGRPDLSDPRWQQGSFISHNPPGYPLDPADPSTPWGSPQGVTGCEAVPFEPTFSATPTTHEADSPSGLTVDLSVPQAALETGEGLAQSDLKDAVVSLPAGMTVNPSSADGLGGCTQAQVGLDDTSPVNCPDSSKIGTVAIQTPLLDHTAPGAVYLAAQGDNPFKSLLALYIVVEDPKSGVVLKLPGKVEADPQSGRLTTTFSNQPQLPFSQLHIELKSGARAPLRTPPTCGTYKLSSQLTPWSGNAAASASNSFAIDKGPAGGPCPKGAFDPKLAAGTANPIAGAYSPFSLRLTRADGTQELGGLSATLPPGLVGKLAGIPYCPDAALASIPSTEGTGAAQLANPACPAASQLGTVTVGAGAGASPFYVRTGRAYLAGPYKGAPLSLAIVTPALAGPFDLGNVLVRAGVRVDPTTTQITTTSYSIPSILDGIPLDLRSIEVALSRPDFTLNPTSCNPMSIDAVASAVGGASAALSNHFQVGDCGALGFKPKLAFRLKGGTRRSDHPAFSATLTARKGDANISRAVVSLPHSEFLAQNHIKTICTRVQFAANACPKGSIYGFAKAVTPLLDKPLEGSVYLRSSSHQLPDLVADLNGQIHVVLDGRIDSHNKGIRNSFELVPDAPVTKFTLSMQGGKKGLLENSRDLCKTTNRASVQLDAQNGKTADSRVVLQNDCKPKRQGKHKHHRG